MLLNETCGLQRLNCDGRASDYLKLQIQTTTTISGEQVCKTFAQGLGIRIQQAGNKQLVPAGITDCRTSHPERQQWAGAGSRTVKEPTTQRRG